MYEWESHFLRWLKWEEGHVWVAWERLGVQSWMVWGSYWHLKRYNNPWDMLLTCSVIFSSVQLLSRVLLFATPWIAAGQASLSITNSQSSLRLMSIESVMPSTISSSVVPFSSCPQSLPASESFPMNQLFAWGGQSAGVSALESCLPKKSQGWSPSERTGWISLQSKGLSRVFSNTTVQKHQFFGGIPRSFNHCQVMLRTPSILPYYAWMTAEGGNVMSLSTEGKCPQDLEGPRSDFRLLRSFWLWAKEYTYPVQRVIFQANGFWHAFW